MEPVLLRLLLVVGIVGVVAATGWWWQRRDGTVVEVDDPDRAARFARDQLDAVGLDLRDVQGAAVLLGSPTCAPCTTVKRILGEVAAERDGFRWVDVDAGAYLDLARAHHVLRVPTLFVLDGEGRIVARTSGVPAKQDLERVLDRAPGESVSLL